MGNRRRQRSAQTTQCFGTDRKCIKCVSDCGHGVANRNGVSALTLTSMGCVLPIAMTGTSGSSATQSTLPPPQAPSIQSHGPIPDSTGETRIEFDSQPVQNHTAELPATVPMHWDTRVGTWRGFSRDGGSRESHQSWGGVVYFEAPGPTERPRKFSFQVSPAADSDPDSPAAPRWPGQGPVSMQPGRPDSRAGITSPTGVNQPVPLGSPSSANPHAQYNSSTPTSAASRRSSNVQFLRRSSSIGGLGGEEEAERGIDDHFFLGNIVPSPRESK
jgi:hypothetical protein